MPSWLAIPPAVVYYNTFDREGDTSWDTTRRGDIARNLDNALQRFYKATGTLCVGVVTVGVIGGAGAGLRRRFL